MHGAEGVSGRECAAQQRPSEQRSVRGHGTPHMARPRSLHTFSVAVRTPAQVLSKQWKQVNRESIGLEQDRYLAACRAILVEAKEAEELGQGTEMVQPADADGRAVGPPLSRAPRLADTFAESPSSRFLLARCGPWPRALCSTVRECPSSHQDSQVMTPPRVLPSIPVVIERIKLTQGRLNLQNVPYVMKQDLLSAFILRELASPYFSDSLRGPILADIRRRETHDASVMPLCCCLCSLPCSVT